MKVLTKVLFLALFSVLAGFAAAQPLGSRPEAALKKAGLTEEQAQKVAGLAAQERMVLVQQRAQLKVLQAQIEQAMVASPTDLAAVNALVDQKVRLQGEIEKGLLAAGAQVHQIVGDQLFLKLRRHLFQAHRTGDGKRKAAGEMGRTRFSAP